MWRTALFSQESLAEGYGYSDQETGAGKGKREEGVLEYSWDLRGLAVEAYIRVLRSLGSEERDLRLVEKFKVGQP